MCLRFVRLSKAQLRVDGGSVGDAHGMAEVVFPSSGLKTGSVSHMFVVNDGDSVEQLYSNGTQSWELLPAAGFVSHVHVFRVEAVKWDAVAEVAYEDKGVTVEVSNHYPGGAESLSGVVAVEYGGSTANG